MSTKKKLTRGIPVDPAIRAAWAAKALRPTAVYTIGDTAPLDPYVCIAKETRNKNPPGLLQELLKGGRYSVRSLAHRMAVQPSTVRGMLTRLGQKGIRVEVVNSAMDGTRLYCIN